jgi:hypothetical protein
LVTTVVGAGGGEDGRDARRCLRPAPPYTHPQVDGTCRTPSLVVVEGVLYQARQ